MNAIYDLYPTSYITPEYARKMMHQVPDATVVSREAYLLERAAGRFVLDIGASGPMSEAIKEAAGRYVSVNIENADYNIDIDRAESLPDLSPDVVIAGEVIEHISNAGHFLYLLSVYSCPIIITTPNAYSSAGMYWNGRGVEQVNPEHVVWYSWYTLNNLLTRHGYDVIEWHWYKGRPLTAEGLIFEVKHGKS